jgi:acyl carrier protein
MFSRIVRIEGRMMPKPLSRFASSAIPKGSYLPLQDVEERVISVVKSIRSAPPSVERSHHFVADLHFDSLIRKDLTSKLEDEFCVSVSSKDADQFLAVSDAINFFVNHPKAR